MALFSHRFWTTPSFHISLIHKFAGTLLSIYSLFIDLKIIPLQLDCEQFQLTLYGVAVQIPLLYPHHRISRPV